jgi:hypothetical protein
MRLYWIRVSLTGVTGVFIGGKSGLGMVVLVCNLWETEAGKMKSLRPAWASQ